MADFLAVAGGIYAVLGTIDIMKKCYDAVKDKSGLPEAFREARESLPLVEAILKSAQEHEPQMNDRAREAIRPFITKCKENADNLQKIFEQVMPGPEASCKIRYIMVLKIMVDAAAHPISGSAFSYMEDPFSNVLKKQTILSDVQIQSRHTHTTERLRIFTAGLIELKEQPSLPFRK